MTGQVIAYVSQVVTPDHVTGQVTFPWSRAGKASCCKGRFVTETHTSTPREETTNRFHIDATKKEEWTNTFRSYIKDRDILAETDPATASKSYHEAITATCECHLAKIKLGTPKGVVWWNQDCADKLLTLRHSPVGDQRRAASKDFKSAVRNAKREWAHQQLFETINADNIWRMA